MKTKIVIASIITLMFFGLAIENANSKTEYGFVSGSHLVTSEGEVIEGFDDFAKRNHAAGLDGKRVTVWYENDEATRLTTDGETWLEASIEVD